MNVILLTLCVVGIVAASFGAYVLVRPRGGGGPSVGALWKWCATDSPGAGVVAFDDKPVGSPPATDRLHINAWDGTPRYGRLPGYWYELRQQGDWLTLHVDDPVLFLHALKSRSGQTRLVLVYGHPTWPGSKTVVQVGATILSPATLIPAVERECVGPAIEDGDRTSSTGLRIFAGQADAKDAAHFTIGFQVNGVAGVIDGRLGPDAAGQEVVEMRMK